MVFINTQLGTSSVDETIRSSVTCLRRRRPVSVVTAVSADAAVSAAAAVPYTTFDSLRLGRTAQSLVGRLIRFWNAKDIDKNMELLGITLLLLDEKVMFLSDCYMIQKYDSHSSVRLLRLLGQGRSLLYVSVASRDLMFKNRRVRTNQWSDAVMAEEKGILFLMVDARHRCLLGGGKRHHVG
ncbi:Uncharacterized protein Rs2_21714 [Raphanus sativus]|nr:Uncharacterized protein Rs2_21714 [Raphanus sativus]